jgi:hypothetical protein
MVRTSVPAQRGLGAVVEVADQLVLGARIARPGGHRRSPEETPPAQPEDPRSPPSLDARTTGASSERHRVLR